jgi:hypothetical protein
MERTVKVQLLQMNLKLELPIMLTLVQFDEYFYTK